MSPCETTALGPAVPAGVPRLDPDSRAWLAALRGDHAERQAAIDRLHALLLRAARFELARRRSAAPARGRDALDDLAVEAANDALVSVLRRLDDFRGASRFTTWVYKFAILEASAKARRRAWEGREIPLEPDVWPGLEAGGLRPDDAAEQAERLRAVVAAVDEVLTPHQRRVLVALAVNGVPIDVVADRLGTTRGALYKTLHDARRKLRAHLDADPSKGGADGSP